MLENNNYIISLPKVGKKNRMNFFQWSLKDPLKINRYGIPETKKKWLRQVTVQYILLTYPIEQGSFLSVSTELFKIDDHRF